MKKLLTPFIVIFLITVLPTSGQFNEPDLSYSVGTGIGGSGLPKIQAAVMQSDGKIVVVGDFDTYNEASSVNIARLNVDGTLDNTFNAGTAISALVLDVALQSDGKMVLVGAFAGTVIRLNSDGTQDNTFDLDGSGIDGLPYTVAIQGDGRILIGGSFNDYNGTSRAGLLRLNSDGSLDTDFDPGSGANDIVREILIQPDDQILVGGEFSVFNGAAHRSIVRLNSNGSTDNSFTYDTSFDVGFKPETFSMELQADGKIIVGGNIANFGRLFRFNSDGSLDFIRNIDGFGLSLATTSTDIYVGMNFEDRITVFDVSDGSSKNILSQTKFDGEVNALLIDSEDKLVAAGSFTHFNGFGYNDIVRLEQCSSVEIDDSPSSFVSVCNDEAAILTTTATGTGLTYKWQYHDGSSPIYGDLSDDSDFSGTSTGTLTISSEAVASLPSGNQFRCVVTDSDCQTTSYSTQISTIVQEFITDPIFNITCDGETISYEVQINGSTDELQWQEDPGTGTFEDISEGGIYSGVNTSTLTLTGVTVEMSGYNYRLTSTLCDGDVSATGPLTVNEFPEINEVDERPKICVSGDADFSVDATSNGTLSYQWQYRISSGFPVVYSNLSEGGVYSGVNSSTLNLAGADKNLTEIYVAENDGTHYAQFRCVVTSNDCSATTSAVKLLAIHEVPTINLQPISDFTLCDTGLGISTSYSVEASNLTSYQWEVDKGNGFEIIENDDIHSGTTSSILNLEGAPASMNGYKYRCNIGSGCSSPVYSEEVDLMIDAIPVINQQPIITHVCEDGNAEMIVEASGNNLVYQWQERIGSSFVDITNNATYFASDGTLQILTIPLSLNNRVYRCVISSGNCSINSGQATLRVYQTPSFSAAPADRTICEGDGTSFSRTATNFNGTVHTYQWQEAFSGSDIFADISDSELFSGTTTSSLTITDAAAIMDGNRYRVKVNGCLDEIASDPATLTVNQLPIISESPLSQQVCEGEPVTFTADAIGNDLTYQWYEDPGTGNFSAVTSAGTDKEYTIDATTINQDGYKYKCLVFGASPCIESVETFDATLTVNEFSIVVDDVVTVSTFPTCEGEDHVIEVQLTQGTPSYQWQIDFNDGNGFVDLTDGVQYSGTTTTQLTVIAPDESFQNIVARCMMDDGLCPVISPEEEINVYPQFDKPVISADESNSSAVVLSIANLPSDFDVVSGQVSWYKDDEYFEASRTLTVTQAGTYTAFLEEVGINVICTSESSDPYTYEEVLGVNAHTDLTIYPNPAKQFLRVDYTKEILIQILSLNGKLVHSGVLGVNRSLDIGHLSAGQFVIQLYDEGKLIHTDKIMKVN